MLDHVIKLQLDEEDSTHKVRVMFRGCSGGCILAIEYSDTHFSKKLALP